MARALGPVSSWECVCTEKGCLSRAVPSSGLLRPGGLWTLPGPSDLVLACLWSMCGKLFRDLPENGRGEIPAFAPLFKDLGSFLPCRRPDLNENLFRESTGEQQSRKRLPSGWRWWILPCL